MSWKNEMIKLIQEKFNLNQNFSLDDIKKYKNHFKNLYPYNNTLDDKIRQTLQYLRDDGYIEFIDYKGNYKRIK